MTNIEEMCISMPTQMKKRITESVSPSLYQSLTHIWEEVIEIQTGSNDNAEYLIDLR